MVWYTRHPALKAVYRAQKQMRRAFSEKLEQLHYKRNLARTQKAVRQTLGQVDAPYEQYIREQLEETLLKKRLKGETRFEVIPLVDMLAEKYELASKSVLCVGCRNTDEIRYFRKRGAGRVVGIDLFSDDPDIVIMDMHDLKFANDEFDIVYSRHSFEHAYDKKKVGSEFVRVVKNGGVVVVEVPGSYKGGADYNRFDSIEDVMVAFESNVGQFLRKEYSRKEDNTHKMDIIRLMFHVDKTPPTSR